MVNQIITDKLKAIKLYTGLELIPCDYFTGIRECNGLKYFNVILNERVSESLVYVKLLRLNNTSLLLKVEPNGLKRVAIFI